LGLGGRVWLMRRVHVTGVSGLERDGGSGQSEWWIVVGSLALGVVGGGNHRTRDLRAFRLPRYVATDTW